MVHTEFFHGRSQQPGSTICRGWLCPDGVQLVLPYSLEAVDPDQDRYSATPQLWRDAEGECWLISYNQAQQEWIGQKLGDDLEGAKVRADAARVMHSRSITPTAGQIFTSLDGRPLSEIWSALHAEDIQAYDFHETGDQIYADVHFRDGSALRVLHPAGVLRPGDCVIEVIAP